MYRHLTTPEIVRMLAELRVAKTHAERVRAAELSAELRTR